MMITEAQFHLEQILSHGQPRRLKTLTHRLRLRREITPERWSAPQRERPAQRQPGLLLRFSRPPTRRQHPKLMGIHQFRRDEQCVAVAPGRQLRLGVGPLMVMQCCSQFGHPALHHGTRLPWRPGPHRRSIKRSQPTILPASSARTPRISRCWRLARYSDLPACHASTGPRTRTSTATFLRSERISPGLPRQSYRRSG
jgi:hypothetical protein